MPRPCFNWLKQRSTTFASFVGLTVKGRWPAAASAEPGPVADLIGPFRDGVGDAPAPRPGADRPRAVALVAEDMDRPGPRSSGADAGHPHRLHHGRELGAVIGVPTGENESKGAAGPVAGQVSLAGQSASGPAERRVAVPPSRAPGACWWARTTVESTDTSQSTSLAASARAWASWNIRWKVPSLAHRLKRVCSAAQDPYRSGTSRQAVPVRNFHTIPFRTVRSSSRFRPRSGRGSRGRTNSHSTPDSSWRRITWP